VGRPSIGCAGRWAGGDVGRPDRPVVGWWPVATGEPVGWRRLCDQPAPQRL